MTETINPPVPRKRLKREDRDREIAAAAVAFFAEVGFGGDTRELARRLGVTQSLIFRYFPSKAALIERVYQEVYVGRWNPYWETIIADRSVSLQDRLVRLLKTSSKVVRNSFGSKAPKLQIVLDKQLDQNMSLSHSWIIAA